MDKTAIRIIAVVLYLLKEKTRDSCIVNEQLKRRDYYTTIAMAKPSSPAF